MQCLPLPPDEVHKHCARQWVTMFEFIVFTVRIRMRRQTKFIEARNTLSEIQHNFVTSGSHKINVKTIPNNFPINIFGLTNK